MFATRVFRLRLGGAVLLGVFGAVGCRSEAVPSVAQRPAVQARFSWDQWTPPDLASLPDDAHGRSIRRGLALMQHTTDSLPGYAPGKIECTSCHRGVGTTRGGAPLTGAFARYPKYLPRSGAVVTVADRVNFCFTRSLGGSRLPHESREMTDMVNYLAFLSTGVPVGTAVPEDALLGLSAKLAGDSAHGAMLFTEKCASCHGTNGEGLGAHPALWGAKGYSIGASMAREERAASFIKHNMPQTAPGSLSERDAFDLAAYIVRQPRPDLPGKERDWPEGGAPYDLPYDTKGHTAFVHVTLLPRAHPAGAMVLPPPRVAPTPWY